MVAGQGQVVAVVGEPGMGKSAAGEFRRLVGREVRYVEGHCLSYRSATPYLPVLDLVRQLCAITPGAARSDCGKVHRRDNRAEFGPDEGGHCYSTSWISRQRWSVWRQPTRAQRRGPLRSSTLALHEAQCHPCILTVENLHWSDATSEEWLTSLVERLTSAALLVLVTYRPGYQPPGWRSPTTKSALSRLRSGDSRTVVQAVLQNASVPETVVRRS